MVRKDRGRNTGGGLAFLVHQDINFDEIPSPITLNSDPHLECQTIAIQGEKENITIRNIYIPPVSSCTQNYSPPINKIFEDLTDASIIVGDFNAHHDHWLTDSNEDARGRIIVDTISDIPFGIINEDLPTRVTTNSSTSPDISISSNDLITQLNWSVNTKMKSDHLPITIQLTAELRRERSRNRTYINFQKANWEEFKAHTENVFSTARPVTDVHKSEKFFRKTLQKAAKLHIPAGRIPKVYNALPTEAAILIDERDEIRKNNPSDARLTDLNQEIDEKINKHRKEKWIKHLEDCPQGSKKLWKTIKNLGNTKEQPSNQGIKFGDKIYHDPKKMANKFNAQYTPEIDKKPQKELRHLKKINDPNIIITTAQTKEAIKKSKSSKALGPDELSPIMLKNLGEHGIKLLTEIYNKSVNEAIIPNIWKTGKIIPLMKPNKPADNGPNYRPISLLSPSAKVLEAILLPSISNSVKLAEHQHGFRKGRSTTTALQGLKSKIEKGLNQKKPVDRTVVVAIDLSKAFDTVDHQLLLKDIMDLHLNDHIKRFLCAYLRGRQTYVVFRGSRSKFRKVKQGVPQGGVLSPTLFNLYMAKIPLPQGTIALHTYADDSTVSNSGPIIGPICKELNEYLSILENWFKSRNLFISPSKSSATLFTTFTGEVNEELPIEINGERVPTVRNPKLLGVHFDGLLKFNHHVKEVRSKLNSKNNVLKAITGTDWGKDKETLTSTYKAIGQSQLNYCCPIWTPNLSKTSWRTLQTAQNSALRTATGNHLMASEQHLHSETKILPVKDHCTMLSKQFLLSTQTNNHPNHINLSGPPRPRPMRDTLKSSFGDEIKGLAPSPIDSDTRKRHLRTIHTREVRKSIQNLGQNKILNEIPPEINKEEKNLPRQARTALSQLRSGYSKMLNSYLARIDPTKSDICPNCNLAAHTTNHLFNCTQKPTNLTVKDLWSKPKEAAKFLGLVADDDDGIT